jgi:methyl-accepting chemotaxis protein
MLASIFVTITTGFLVTIGLLLWQSMGQQEAVAKRHLQQIALTESLRVQQQLDSALNAARDLGNSAWALHQAGLTERRGLDQLLTDYLHQHPDFLSMSLAFEANTFDGKDAEFAGKRIRIRQAATRAMLTVITAVTRRCTTWWIMKRRAAATTTFCRVSARKR